MKAPVVRETIKEILEVIRELYDADVCALFLKVSNMDDDEKLEVVKERLSRIHEAYRKKNDIPPPVLQKYYENDVDLKQSIGKMDVIKFSFAEVQHPSIGNKERYPAREGRAWKYDYRNRPAKWVVFNEIPPEINIYFEGLTAYSIRAKKELFLPNANSIEQYCSVTHLNAFEKGISLACKMVAFLHLKDSESGQIIGIVKIENYEERSDDAKRFNESSKETIESRHYLALIEKLVRKSKKAYDKYSYDKLYGGNQLLEALKTIDNAEGVNREVYQYTRHLFFVLKRDGYVGREEIFNRVISFVEDISSDRILKISGKKSFRTLLEEYRKHEDLMLYGIQGYRDHFMHQFHVFVLGYIIINWIGPRKIAKLVNESLGAVQDRVGEGDDITEDSILRIWFLTAFYHDAAYILEKFNTGISDFLTKFLGRRINIRIGGSQILQEPDQQKSEECKDGRYAEHVESLLKYYYCTKKTNHDLLSHYIDSIIKMDDHGVYSALLLIEDFASQAGIERMHECYVAALAISFHNHRIYNHLLENGQPGISFESFPFGFLLAYCDTAQTWGREGKMKDERVKNSLLGISINGMNIITKILYETDIPTKYPRHEEITEWVIQGKAERFRSKMYKFSIDFNGGTYEKPNHIFTSHFRHEEN